MWSLRVTFATVLATWTKVSEIKWIKVSMIWKNVKKKTRWHQTENDHFACFRWWQNGDSAFRGSSHLFNRLTIFIEQNEDNIYKVPTQSYMCNSLSNVDQCLWNKTLSCTAHYKKFPSKMFPFPAIAIWLFTPENVHNFFLSDGRLHRNANLCAFISLRFPFFKTDYTQKNSTQSFTLIESKIFVLHGKKFHLHRNLLVLLQAYIPLSIEAPATW